MAASGCSWEVPLAHITPQVRDGLLITRQGQTIAVGSAAWHAWLDDAHTTTFRFVHPLATLTVRKERGQRGGFYWYAYHKQAGRLHKGYVGRTAHLTLPRLHAVATRLANGPSTAQRAQVPSTSTTPRPPARDGGLAPDAPDTPDTLLATKLYLPPPRRDVVHRPRLVARLDAGLHGPLTLVVAPAGYGKTTLLGAWRAVQRPDAWRLAWLALDAGDNDLVRFLRYLIAALQRLRPALGHGVLASLRTPHPPAVESLLTLLLNELATLADDAILILDDYHAITDPAIHQAVTYLLDHLPPQVHLAIATRAEPPLPLARLRARGLLAELRAADLRFSADEAAAFLQQTMGLPLAAEDVAALEERTEGWIAGLHLAALALHGHDPVHHSARIGALTGTHRYILDYLADEVFARQQEDVRRFLLRTSVLDRLSGPLCDGLTATEAPCASVGDSQTMLEQLEAANLFLVPLDDTRTWYRYHHLFADFLRERLRREDRGLVPELHRRAGHWYEQQGLLAEATDHALAAGDDALAARLIEQVSGPLIWQQGELTTLQRWLERLPGDVIRTRPRLCLDLAWVLLWSGHVEAVEPWLGAAEHALTMGILPVAQPTGLHSGVPNRAGRGEIAAVRAELARQRGELDVAIALAQQALDDLPIHEGRVRRVTTGLLAGAYLARGDAGTAIRAFGAAAAHSEAAETMTLALFARGRLIQAQAVGGQLQQAAKTYRSTVALAGRYGMAALPALGLAQVGMGEVLREWNDLAAADALLREGIDRCLAPGGSAELALDGALTLARVVQARGDAAGAYAVLDQAETRGHAGHVTQVAERVAAARARLWLTAAPGEVTAAQHWAWAREEVWPPDGTSGEDGDAATDYVGTLECLTLARLRLVEGRHDAAARLLQRLRGHATAGGLIAVVLEVLALQARLFLEQNQMARALLALGEALALAEPEGYVRLFVDEGMPMVVLLQHARKRGVAPAYVAALLAACGRSAEALPPAARILIDPLSAREGEVLWLLAVGLSTAEIAAQLFITTATVRSHLKHIYGKLDAHSRLQAVDRARRLGLMS